MPPSTTTASTASKIGGSLENKLFKKALAKFGINKIQQRNKYQFIANTLGITPLRRNKKGELTNTPLKVGGIEYKKFIEAETIRRYNEVKELAEKDIEARAKAQKALLKDELVASAKPKVEEIKRISKVGKFEKFYYQTSGVKTLADLYKIIRKEEKKLGGVNYIILFFVNPNNPKINKGMSIGADYLDSFEDFENRIEQIKLGKFGGK
jgi:hypothetical protein